MMEFKLIHVVGIVEFKNHYLVTTAVIIVLDKNLSMDATINEWKGGYLDICIIPKRLDIFIVSK